MVVVRLRAVRVAVGAGVRHGRAVGVQLLCLEGRGEQLDPGAGLPEAAWAVRERALELDCIDRVYCTAYLRKLTYPGGVASFFTHHRGATFASTALADPISKQFVASILRFAADGEIPVMHFEKGPRKDDIAHLVNQ